jgi:uncharacterized protein YndB with AHSA1/START domain
VSKRLFRAAMIAASLLGLALPALAAIKDASPSGFTAENSVVVMTDPASAWQALVGGVDAWWPKDHSWWGAAGTFSIDARAGGCFCEKSGERQAQHLQVVFVDPGKLLRLTGGLGPLQAMGLYGVLEWRLVPVDGGTRITYWYRAGGYTPDDLRALAGVVDQVQAQQLGGLARYIAERGAQPTP